MVEDKGKKKGEEKEELWLNAKRGRWRKKERGPFILFRRLPLPVDAQSTL